MCKFILVLDLIHVTQHINYLYHYHLDELVESSQLNVESDSLHGVAKRGSEVKSVSCIQVENLEKFHI